jgi:hypothetical protein
MDICPHRASASVDLSQTPEGPHVGVRRSTDFLISGFPYSFLRSGNYSYSLSMEGEGKQRPYKPTLVLFPSS